MATARTNTVNIWIKGNDITEVNYVETEHDITGGQPWDSFHASCSSSLLTITVKAGRKGSGGVADWFNSRATKGMCGCDTADARPGSLNFAFNGYLTFKYNGGLVRCDGVLFGQGHNARDRNNWWMGLADVEYTAPGTEDNIYLSFHSKGGTENEFELTITAIPPEADL